MLEDFTAWVTQAGMFGYLVFIVVYAICCVLVIPASALSLAAGAIFGFAAGSAVVLIGATLGSTAAFLLGRTLLRRRVERVLATNPKLAAIDRALAAEGTKVMLLMRLSGFPPFTWINYALALTGVPLVPYILATFFGIIPGVLAFTYAGAAGAAALSGDGNQIGLLATAAGAVLVSVYIARIATRAVRRSAAID
jgi:uncharacterized membrane protein YdjX (TVP38/TMEM64 family)